MGTHTPERATGRERRCGRTRRRGALPLLAALLRSESPTLRVLVELECGRRSSFRKNYLGSYFAATCIVLPGARGLSKDSTV